MTYNQTNHGLHLNETDWDFLKKINIEVFALSFNWPLMKVKVIQTGIKLQNIFTSTFVLSLWKSSLKMLKCKPTIKVTHCEGWLASLVAKYRKNGRWPTNLGLKRMDPGLPTGQRAGECHWGKDVRPTCRERATPALSLSSLEVWHPAGIQEELRLHGGT